MSDVIERLEDELTPEGFDLDREDWSVTTLDEAAWASRKAARARTEAARVQAWREREIARVNAAADKAITRAEGTAAFFENHLITYLRAEVAAGREAKSLELPGGTVRLRKAPVRVTLDADRFIAWAKRSAPELVDVQTVEKPKLAELKKVAELTEDGTVILAGEIVEGAEWSRDIDAGSFDAATVEL